MIEVAIACILREGASGPELLASRRQPAAILGGLWEFPGGKIRPAEAPVQAALRELQEEVGWAPAELAPLMVLTHTYPHGVVRLHAFRGFAGASASPRAVEVAEVRWVPLDRVLELTWLPANGPILDRLCRDRLCSDQPGGDRLRGDRAC